MVPPQIGHLTFSILAALADGRPRSYAQIMSRLDWSTTENHLMILIPRLWKQGLLEKYADRRAKLLRWRISTGGRQQFRETLDWYLHFAKRFSELADDPADVADFERLEPPTTDAAPSHRPPNEAEADAIIAAGSPAFQRIYRASRILDVTIAELVSLDVADADLENRTLYIREPSETRRRSRLASNVPLGPVAFELIEQQAASGGRDADEPLFKTPTNKRWTARYLAETFERVREIAGVPPEVKLRGLCRPRRKARSKVGSR